MYTLLEGSVLGEDEVDDDVWDEEGGSNFIDLL